MKVVGVLLLVLAFTLNGVMGFQQVDTVDAHNMSSESAGCCVSENEMAHAQESDCGSEGCSTHEQHDCNECHDCHLCLHFSAGAPLHFDGIVAGNRVEAGYDMIGFDVWKRDSLKSGTVKPPPKRLS